MTITIPHSVSRRALIGGGLASGFVLAFHLPFRAANEPVQTPESPIRNCGT